MQVDAAENDCPVDVNGIVARQRREPEMPGGYYIHTAYPLP